jgi:hypothetical protein
MPALDSYANRTKEKFMKVDKPMHSTAELGRRTLDLLERFAERLKDQEQGMEETEVRAHIASLRSTPMAHSDQETLCAHADGLANGYCHVCQTQVITRLETLNTKDWAG